MRCRAWLVATMLVLGGCGGEDTTGSGAGRPGGSGGSGGDGAVTSGEATWEDPGADSSELALPADVVDTANAIVNAQNLDGAVAAVNAALAKGGLSVIDTGTVISEGAAPKASGYVDLGVVADLALEARQRKQTGTLTGTELGALLSDIGWTVPVGKTPGQTLMELLAGWTNAALAAPDDPASFPILFIAANNQLQTPRANLSLATQNPDTVRFSLLDLEMFLGAFDRVTVSPETIGGMIGPCARLKSTLGKADKPGQIVLGMGSSAVMENTVQTIFEGNSGKTFSSGLSDLKLLAKIAKFAQYMRYGQITAVIDTENPTRKPLPSQGTKPGKVTAHTGVDTKTYDEYQAWLGQYGAKALMDVNACFAYLGLPQKTDIADVAKDIPNWRVAWTIEAGGGTQVTYAEGQDYKVASRRENPVTPVSATEAISSIDFAILPQLAEIENGTERKWSAVFSAELRRGKMPDAGTLWGGGKAGFKAGQNPNLNGEINITGPLVDIFGNWLLEVAGPKAYARQELIEIIPRGWVGTILLTEEGRGNDETMAGMHPHASWSGWSANVKYQSRLDVGTTDPTTVDEKGGFGMGRAVADCAYEYKQWHGLDECYEGCPSTVPPAVSHGDRHATANWGIAGKYPGGPPGLIAHVAVVAYDEATFGPIKDKLPASIRDKIGTYELTVAMPDCGRHEGTDITFEYVYDEPPIPPLVETFVVEQEWLAPFPPMKDQAPPNTLTYTGKLEGDQMQIELDLEMPRKVRIEQTYDIDSVLRFQVNLKRVK